MFGPLAYPRAIGAYLFGNTDMVMVAAVAGGLDSGWPAILVTIKPSPGPGPIGIRHRSWWIAGDRAGLRPPDPADVVRLYFTALRNIRPGL